MSGRAEMTSQAARRIRATPRIRIPIGTLKFRGGSRSGQTHPIAWDSHNATNGHIAMIGGSGSGKTHQLRRFITGLAQGGARVHVIDPHGDLIINASLTDSITFSDSTEFGLNPLEVESDPIFGGVRRQANSFVNLLLRQTTLGDKQKGALFRLLIELYRRYGFELENPRTWGLDYDPRTWATANKRHPTLQDLTKAVWEKCVALKLGATGSAVRKFEEVVKLQKTLHGLRLKKARLEDVEVKLEKAKKAFMEAMGTALTTMETGEELQELIAWDSFDVVKGIHDRMVSLEQSGIFKGNPPRFDVAKKVWRYDIAPLSRAESQFFVDCLLTKIFRHAKARGEAEGPDTVIVIDEASIFVDKDGDHIINILIREGRKFGVMIILAAQEVSVFPPAILSSTATKLILGVDDLYHKSTEDRMGLERGKLKFLKPRKTALVQCKRSVDDSLGQGFYDVEIAG